MCSYGMQKSSGNTFKQETQNRESEGWCLQSRSQARSRFCERSRGEWRASTMLEPSSMAPGWLVLTSLPDSACHSSDECCPLATAIFWLEEGYLAFWRELLHCLLHYWREAAKKRKKIKIGPEKSTEISPDLRLGNLWHLGLICILA